ncbi:hypothetical protein COO60DRAFT_1624972 [Scenedesmus sp. NREL 46B-D3]|nr:hypothetical protein COO60DRAFT_1624972 [Scenedesmus sp. NREL 46B-D3]
MATSIPTTSTTNSCVPTFPIYLDSRLNKKVTYICKTLNTDAARSAVWLKFCRRQQQRMPRPNNHRLLHQCIDKGSVAIFGIAAQLHANLGTARQLMPPPGVRTPTGVAAAVGTCNAATAAGQPVLAAQGMLTSSVTAMASELQRLSDPNYAISLAVGPPFAELKPQAPGSGLVLTHHFSSQPRRFVLKKAHLSRDDFRVFDASSGRPVAVLHHFGKNPYDSLDPLSLGNFTDAHQNMESKLKAMALRSNLAVQGPGDAKELMYSCLECCWHALVAALGSGSEMMIDVAAGVDWTAMIAVIMAVQQVGAHIVKDAFGNFVYDPLKDSAVQAALTGSGMQVIANTAGGNIDGALHFVRKMQMVQQMFVQ